MQTAYSEATAAWRSRRVDEPAEHIKIRSRSATEQAAKPPSAAERVYARRSRGTKATEPMQTAYSEATAATEPSAAERVYARRSRGTKATERLLGITLSMPPGKA